MFLAPIKARNTKENTQIDFYWKLHELPLWKNNRKLDQKCTSYCLVFIYLVLLLFGLSWYILVGYAGIFWLFLVYPGTIFYC
jgi:ABC-type branched-subunit amino acid transport system permease subunit